MDLLLKSHKEGWKTDDHLGKLASRDGKFFYDSPARMDADINVLKNVLLENIGHLGGLEVMEDEVVKMRWHGAKATLTTVMQHLNLPPRVVRFAGDWGAAGESMADLYLREAQLLTLAAQQKALMYLRMGGGVVGLVGEPVYKQPKSKDGQPFSFEEVSEAMANSEDNPEVAVHEVPQEFYDKCFEKGLPDMELVEAEVGEEVSAKELEPLLEEVDVNLVEDDPETEEETGRSFKKMNKKNETAEDAEPLKDMEPPQPLEEESEEDEAMVSSFVMVAKPTPASKLHLRLAPSKQEVLGSARPVPRCGARGLFEEVRADEELSAGLCSRCFGKSGCDHLCAWTKADSQGTGKLRCSRRCSLDGSDHVQHFCAFHVWAEKTEGGLPKRIHLRVSSF